MQILFCIFYPLLLSIIGVDCTVLKIGYLPSMSSEGGTISGAVAYAIDEINNNSATLPNVTLELAFLDNGGSTFTSVNALTKLWKAGAVAFIGPEDSCFTEAKVASSWNLPMISHKCDDSAVSDKTKFPTFARTNPSNSDVTKSIISLMIHYKWKKFTVVSGVEETEVRSATTLMKLAEENNITINDYVNYTNPVNFNFTAIMTKIIKDTYKDTRVYVLFTGSHPFIQFVRQLEVMGIINATSNDYVVIGVKPLKFRNRTPLEGIRQVLERDYEMTHEQVLAFRNVLQLLTTPPLDDAAYSNWQSKAQLYNCRAPFQGKLPCLPEFLRKTSELGPYAAHLFDATKTYARALHEVLEAGGSAEDGKSIIANICDRVYSSVRGTLSYIDRNGDAEGNYTILALVPNETITFGWGLTSVGHFVINHDGAENIPMFLEAIEVWPNGTVPIDEPRCGYYGDKCVPVEDYTWHITGGILGGLVLLLLIVMLVLYRNWKYEQELASLIWKINFSSIQLTKGFYQSNLSVGSEGTNSRCTETSISRVVDPAWPTEGGQGYDAVGYYRGHSVSVKWIRKKNIDLTRNVKLELKRMRDLRHDNITHFVGACVDFPNNCIITEYCSKGTLQDMLANDDVKLDRMFQASLINDTLKGMMYLHASEIGSHGDLRSATCYIDSRWVLKISDFGLHEFKRGQDLGDEGEHAIYSKLFGTAPELLRDPHRFLGGTPKGDIYSFGILLFEIMGRTAPYDTEDLDAKEVIGMVKNPASYKLLRPATDTLECQPFLIDIMKSCWSEDPISRPDFILCRKLLKPMQKGMKHNIFDNMIAIMEKYANNLEELVAERTGELVEEKKKTETLLHRMLPRSVAERLKRGDPIIPETFESVTIYFSDICGFTALSSESTPMQVVDLLNDLYTLFDSIIKNYDVYKVETIGDAYMCVSGLPQRNGKLHAGEIASMSLHLLRGIKEFKIKHRPNDILKLRIGIHTGSCVTGVVGLTMPRYCLFGDTVNTASRMESNGLPLAIHVSSDCMDLLTQLGGYVLSERGYVAMKGKGEVLTFWLESEITEHRAARIMCHQDVKARIKSQVSQPGAVPSFLGGSNMVVSNSRKRRTRKSLHGSSLKDSTIQVNGNKRGSHTGNSGLLPIVSVPGGTDGVDNDAFESTQISMSQVNYENTRM